MHYRCLPVGLLQANCYLVWDEQGTGLVIDPGDEGEWLVREIQQQGLAVAAIVLTHVHFDHFLAAQPIQAHTGAPLYVPAVDAPALTDPARNLTALTRHPYTLPSGADHLLREGDTFTVGQLSFSVWHTPGHTPGSSCYQIEHTLFSGDTLFQGSVGRTDLPGGDATALQRSLQRLAALPEHTTILPGHGQSTTIGQEKQNNPYLRGGHLL